MGHHEFDKSDLEENFTFSSAAKRKIFILIGLGALLTALGVVFGMMGGGDDHGGHALSALNGAELAAGGEAGADAHGGDHGHHGPTFFTRIIANLWINAVYLVGISLIGTFFIAIQYVSMAGWSTSVKRIPEAMATFLPVAGVLLIGIFFLGNHDLFHWTHEGIMDKGSDNYDAIIAGKEGFLNLPFYIARMVLFLGVWILFGWLIRKQSHAEDRNGGLKHYRNMVKMSAVFIVFFGISTSIAAWDWVMSIDTHWFSTMFGWYNFASWWAGGLATITFIVILLKEAGYLKVVNENHLHDLGKFVFAFSIFWTYIWFSQFLLIYYANIPEETVYFMERLSRPQYAKFIFINLIINFVFPFLGLMTRDAKRKVAILKLVCVGVFIGHWLDFYLMVTPGTMKDQGGFGLLEVGMAMFFTGIFAFWVGSALTKAPLIAKNHPLLPEALNHHT